MYKALRNKIKDAIETHEYYTMGLNKLSGAYVKAMNIKQKPTCFIADVVIFDGDGGSIRTNDVEYSLTIIDKNK